MSDTDKRHSDFDIVDTQSTGDSATDVGDTKSSTRSTQPQRTPEDESGNARRLNGFDAISPFDVRITGDSTSGIGTDQPRRRGRPPGSRNRTGSTPAQSSFSTIADLESLLLSAHFMGAQILKVQELAIEPDEAKRMSEAITEVARQYRTSFDPKKVALANLLMVSAGIYGPRAFAIYKRETGKAPVVSLNPPTPIDRPKPKTSETPVTQPSTVSLANMSPSQLYAQAGGNLEPAGFND